MFPSNAYCPWTPNYTSFVLGLSVVFFFSFGSVCLIILNFAIVYIDFMIFRNMNLLRVC